MGSTEVFHKAAQYLAAAAKSFIPSEPDDSHTSLHWDPSNAVLRTGRLDDEGLVLELNHQVYALDVVHPRSGLSASFPLTGARHFDIISWLDREREFCGIKEPFQFDLHYELPYDVELDEGFVYPSLSGEAINGEIQRRDQAHAVLKTASDGLNLDNPIRIWPHHFDSAISVEPVKGDLSFIGIGVAIPDAVCDEHYIYVSAYKGEKPFDPSELAPLSIGKWKSGDWKGALLPLEQHPKENGSAFVQEAFRAMMKAYD